MTAPLDTQKPGRLLATTLLAALFIFAGYVMTLIALAWTLERWAVGVLEAVATVLVLVEQTAGAPVGDLYLGTRTDLEASIAVAAAGPFALAAAVALWSALPLAVFSGLDPILEAILWTPFEYLLTGALAIVCLLAILVAVSKAR